MNTQYALTPEQKLQQLKKNARVITAEDQIRTSEIRFEQMGLDREDVERMADVVGLNADDIYLASSGEVIVEREQQHSASKDANNDLVELGHRLRHLEEFVSQIAASRNIAAPQFRAESQYDLVSEIRRIADHFDPPNLEVVGTSYIAAQLGVTSKWVGDLVRNGKIPNLCICPKSGAGNYWRFWKKPIDEWLQGRIG